MPKFFEKEIGILVDDDPIFSEFQLCESGFEECKPTKPYEFIMIDYWVVHYCIDGEGYFGVRDKQNHIHPGDIFMIPPNTKNKYFPDVANPWSYLWIGVKGTLAERVLESCGLTQENYILHHKVDSRLQNLFEATYDEMQRNHNLKALGQALQLLDYIQHNVHNDSSDQITSGELYFNNITISDIAAAANIDRTYMFKLFQKFLKQSPSQYLQQYRLDKASVLLRKSALSITDVSYAVGFQHPPYFTKLFTQYKNITPSEYRKGFLQ